MQRGRTRLVLAAVAAAVTAVALVGCSGGGGDNGGGDKTTDIKGAKLTFWYPNNATAADVEAFAKAWAKKNGVKLTITLQPSDQSLQTLALALQSNRGPDVWNGQNGTVQQFGRPLQKIVSKETLDAYAKYIDAPSGYSLKGNIVGIPTTINAQRLAYNRDLFTAAGLDPDKPPTSLDQMRTDCAAIVEKTDGYCIGLPVGWAAFPSQYIDPLTEVSTANVTSNGLFDVKTGKFKTELYAPVVKFLREAVQKGWAYPGASSLDNDTMRATFAKGDIGMFVSASWDITELNDKYKTTVDWAAAKLPTIDGKASVRQIATAGNPFLINRSTKEPEAAAALVDALTGQELNAKLAATGTVFPARADAVAKDKSGFDKQYANYTVTKLDGPHLQSPAYVMPITGTPIYKELAALVLGNDDIDSTLAKYADEYQKVYDNEVKLGTINPKDYTRK
jgi:multiple sugar transport system substrate-binding protein